MLLSVVFLLAALAFLGLVILPNLYQNLNLNKKDKPIKGDDLPVWPFETMPIMTDTEVLFFEKLQQAIPECYVFSQVQLSRIIEPSADAGSDRRFWFNRICRQSVDYVLVDADAQTTIMAIELDDWTHESASRQKADAKKDKALASAGIPILRFNAERMPNADILRQQILQVIKEIND